MEKKEISPKAVEKRERVCRLCSIKTCTAKDVFSVDLIRKNILSLARRHLKVVIKRLDKLTSICELCMQKLEQFHVYYELVKNTQEMLSIYLNDPEVDCDVIIAKDHQDSSFNKTNIQTSIHQDSSAFEISYTDESKSNQIEVQQRAFNLRIVNFEKENVNLSCNNEGPVSKNSPLSQMTDPLLVAQTEEENCIENSQNMQSIQIDAIKIEDIIDEESSWSFDEDINSILSTSDSEKSENSQHFTDTEQIIDSDPYLKEIKSANFQFPKCIMKNGRYRVPRKYLPVLVEKFFALTCHICSEKDQFFENLHSLFTHYRYCHQTQGYVVCCEKKFYNTTFMIFHMARHIDPEEFTCKQCGKQVSNPHKLKIHASTHLPDEKRRFQCSKCPRGFSTKRIMMKHEKLHENGNVSSTCNKCGKTFSSYFELSIHNAQEHFDSSCKYACGVCDEKFDTSSKFAYHFVQHEGSFECKICKKWMRKDSYYKHNKEVHSTIKKNCTLCDYTTFNERNLRHHVNNKHSAEKKYLCAECGRNYKTKNGLETHMFQHTGIKKYSCEFCPKQFAANSNYFTHRKRIHAKEIAEKQEEQLQKQSSNEFTVKNNSAEH